jgi:hypothetical protein
VVKATFGSSVLAMLVTLGLIPAAHAQIEEVVVTGDPA